MNTSYHTLAADMIKCAWLKIMYLLYVVYVAPPPTLLVYYLKNDTQYQQGIMCLINLCLNNQSSTIVVWHFPQMTVTRDC